MGKKQYLHEMTGAEVIETIADRHAQCDPTIYDLDARGPRDAYVVNRMSWKFFKGGSWCKLELVRVPVSERDENGLPWFRWQLAEVS